MEVTPSDSASLPVASAAPSLTTAWGQDGWSPLTRNPVALNPAVWFWTLPECYLCYEEASGPGNSLQMRAAQYFELKLTDYFSLKGHEACLM